MLSTKCALPLFRFNRAFNVRTLSNYPGAIRQDGKRSSSKSKASLVNIPVESKLPERARVVIAGSGLIGNSVAYHLIQNGWKEVVIIDRGNIADGTSKYGSGMLGLFRPQNERQIVQYCIDLYRSLQKQGFDIGLKVKAQNTHPKYIIVTGFSLRNVAV